VGFALPASAGSGIVASAAVKEAARQSGCETLSLRSIEECFKGD
jgi:F0F1-type ATP synthase membrane subunit c/vacuolar-type H+-ATPase subunit K